LKPNEVSLETDSNYVVPLNTGLSNYDDAAVRSIDYSGDINRDQHRDLVVGDPVNSQVYVLFGNRLGTTTTSLGMKYGFVIFGEKSSSDSFGWAVSSHFDFNNDGYDDIIIGAILLNRCYIIFGKSNTESVYTNALTTTTVPEHHQGIKMIGSTRTARNTGMSVSSAGDFNGDGFHDVIFSAATINSANIIYIVYGSRNPPNEFILDNLTPSQGIRIFGTPLSYAGISVSWLGDVNGDGIDDIIIGSLPFSNGYTTQRSYLLYGNKNQSLLNNLQLQSIPHTVGSTIVGGGIVVTGPSDINNDGLNDILVTNYENWQGKSGVFMIQYPVEYTSKPSKQPTSVPTGFWTNLPSPSPTETPTAVPSVRPSVPTVVPSTVPSGSTLIPSAVPSNPTSRPTTAPITPTVVPTRILSKKPSVSPTRAPKTGKPVVTLIPTLSPTVSPSQTPSIRPTRTPTRKLTPIPSTRTPSQFPTSHPSLLQIDDDGSDNSFLVITVTEKGGTVSNSSSPRTAVKVAYLINANNDSTITGAGKVNKYIIEPNTNVRVTITNFNLGHDVIDVSRFPHLKNITDIMYVINPFLTIILPNNEQIIFESYSDFVLTERNFIFAPEQSNDTSIPILTRDVVLTLGFAGFVLIGTYLYFQFSERSASEEKKKSKRFSRHSALPLRIPVPVDDLFEEDGDIETGRTFYNQPVDKRKRKRLWNNPKSRILRFKHGDNENGLSRQRLFSHNSSKNSSSRPSSAVHNNKPKPTDNSSSSDFPADESEEDWRNMDSFRGASVSSFPSESASSSSSSSSEDYTETDNIILAEANESDSVSVSTEMTNDNKKIRNQQTPERNTQELDLEEGDRFLRYHSSSSNSSAFSCPSGFDEDFHVTERYNSSSSEEEEQDLNHSFFSFEEFADLYL
jgi:hypothetical protein